MSKIKIGAQVTAKVRPTKVTVSGTFQGYRLEDQEDPTSICGTVLHVKDGMQHLDYVYVDSIKVCESEDERIRKRIRLCLDECVHSDIIRDYERDECLAYLEKQKESLHIPETCKENADSFTDVQKPAEWSDEDRTTIERIVETIQDYAMETGQIDEVTCGTKEPLITYIRFLRSLRPQPHWKPSEEQMEALKDAFRKDGGNEYRKVINSLYRDLEKLL